jgi:hypothetical protein
VQVFAVRGTAKKDKIGPTFTALTMLDTLMGPAAA